MNEKRNFDKSPTEKEETVAQSEFENVEPEPQAQETVGVLNPETGEKTYETQEVDEPNIKFIGGPDRLPEKAFNAGVLGRITMPDAEVQSKPFYHPKANIIVEISPFYKAVTPKGR